MTPLVSVLTPSLNQGRWLRQNLDSVARQSYRRTEHIVVDGASTDGSVEILSRYPGDRLLWTSERDDGQSAAINKAFASSRGEIVGWLNSDDAYFRRNAVEAAVRIFENRPEVAVVYGHAVLADARGAVLHTMWVPPYDYRLLRIHDFIVQPATFVRRAALGDRMVDPSFDYMMDYELWLWLGQSYPFARLPMITAIDRHHEDRKSLRRPDLATTDFRRLVELFDVETRDATRPMRKLLRIAIRLMGATLVRQAVGGVRAYDSPADNAVDVLVRQLLVSRSRMLRT